MAGFNTVDILNKALFKLKQDLRPDDVLDYLLSEGVLTQSEFDRCREHPGRQSQCGELIDILRHKGENGYKHFCIILERTQGHLKTLLDGIARDGGASKYVYVSETDMEAALRERDSVITEKDKIIDGKEEKLQMKNSEIQSLETSHEDEIKQLEEKHVNAMNKMREEHAVSIEHIKQEKNNLQTELIQEQERKQAVDQRLEEERKQTLDCKEEIVQLTKKLVKLEEKYESCTTVQILKPPKTTKSFDTTAVEPGQCVLKTAAECNNKQLLLLPCLHDVCQPCVDQHSHKTIICGCGQQVDLEKERLLPDFVSRNLAMLSTKEFQCSYLTEPCLKEVVSHCTTCNIPLCQDCQEFHAKSRMNTTHEVIAVEHIEENPPWKHPGHTTCTDHPRQQLVYLDKHCKKSICNICYTGKHEDHEVRALEKEYEERKNQQCKDLQKQGAHLEEFRQCLKDRQRHLSSLYQKHDQMQHKISAIHEQNAVKYLHRIKELSKALIDETEKVEALILEDIQYLSAAIAALETTNDYAKMSLEFTSQAELLELADVITNRISEDLTRSLLEDRTKDKDIVYCNHGQRALEQLVEMFGHIEATDTSNAEDDNIPTHGEFQERCQGLETEIQQLQTTIASITKEAKSTESDLQRRIENGNQSLEHLEKVLTGLFPDSPLHLLKTMTADKCFILQCVHLKYDLDRVNLSYVHIDNNGMLVNKPGKGPTGNTSGRFQKYSGTTSTVPLPQTGHPQYMEVVCGVGIDKPLEEYTFVLELGVCREEEMDVIRYIPAHKYCYSLYVSQCPNHNSVCTRVQKDDKLVHHVSDTLPNTVGSHTTLHYGMVYDSNRNVIIFIDAKRMNIIKVLDNVNYDKPMWPMFGVYAHAKARISMKLVAGNDIDMTPEKKTMILKAL